MTDPTTFWLDKIRQHTQKIARLTSHIEFLGQCIAVGIAPKGLSLKLPTSGVPPEIRPTFEAFGIEASLQLTITTMLGYCRMRSRILQDHLLPLIKIMSFVNPLHTNLINVFINKAHLQLGQYRKQHLKKLSKLYLNHLHKGIPVAIQHINIHPQSTSSGALSSSILGNPPNIPPSCLPQTQHPTSTTHHRDNIGEVPKKPESNICNLSSRPLSDSEVSVLSKGLSFAPTPKVNHVALHEDIQAFCRRLRLQYFWNTIGKELECNTMDPIHSSLQSFKPPSDVDLKPLPASHPLEQFISQLIQKTSQPAFLNSLKPKRNMTHQEHKSLMNLKQDQTIKIMPADKGSTIVIMNAEDYYSEVNRQLQNERFYKKIDRDPTPEFSKKLKQFLKTNGETEGLTKPDINLLLPPKPRLPEFYILPKIHKEFHMPEAPPPGRPIVASFGSLTERISSYLDHVLQPIVQKIPSYIKDSYSFLEILSNIKLPPNPEHPVLIATIDVKSLYSEIPMDEGLAALEHFLNQRDPQSKPSTAFLTKLAEFILTMNVFSFRDQLYIQTRGTAMGTKAAPAYANLFMAKLEEEFLSSRTLKPLVWKRFIDDIFIIWTHGEQNLNHFLEDLNTSSSVSFTWHYSTEKSTFLDIDITHKNDSFTTSIHVKPTNKQIYLHHNSCHPPHTFKAIPRSLSIRAHRICNSFEKKEEYLSNTKRKLEERGYPSKLLDQRIIPPTAIWNPQPKTEPTHNLYLTTNFFFGIQKMNGILRELFPILSSNSQLQKIFPHLPTISYRKNQTIGSILSHKRSKPPTISKPPGLHPCQKSRCKLCSIVLEESSFSSPNNPNTYMCRGSSTCQTKNVVYELLCQKCSAFYIGKTITPLNLRMNQHRSSVTRGLDLPINVHAASHQATFDECFKLKVLRSLPPEANDTLVRLSEQAHAHVLGAYKAPGLNIYK